MIKISKLKKMNHVIIPHKMLSGMNVGINKYMMKLHAKHPNPSPQ